MSTVTHKQQSLTDGEEQCERDACNKTATQLQPARASGTGGDVAGMRSRTQVRVVVPYEVFPAVMLGKLLELEKQVVVANCACDKAEPSGRSLPSCAATRDAEQADDGKYRKSCRRGR